jgi:hypothetical protein
MGFLDAATDIANKASSALDSVTGGQKTGTSSGKAEFVKDDVLTDKDAKQGGSAAPASGCAQRSEPDRNCCEAFRHEQ